MTTSVKWVDSERCTCHSRISLSFFNIPLGDFFPSGKPVVNLELRRVISEHQLRERVFRYSFCRISEIRIPSRSVIRTELCKNRENNSRYIESFICFRAVLLFAQFVFFNLFLRNIIHMSNAEVTIRILRKVAFTGQQTGSSPWNRNNALLAIYVSLNLIQLKVEIKKKKKKWKKESGGQRDHFRRLFVQR